MKHKMQMKVLLEISNQIEDLIWFCSNLESCSIQFTLLWFGTWCVVFCIGNNRQQALSEAKWNVWGSVVPGTEGEGKEFFGVQRGNGRSSTEIGPRWPIVKTNLKLYKNNSFVFLQIKRNMIKN